MVIFLIIKQNLIFYLLNYFLFLLFFRKCLVKQQVYRVVQDLQQCRTCKNKKVGLDGKKYYYICKKARGFTCQASLYILEHPDKTAGIFRCSNMAHNHPVQCPVKVGINPETKTEIEKLYNSGVQKPSLILRSLSEQDVMQPTIVKLN